MQIKLETRVGLLVLVGIAIFMYMGFQVGAFRFDAGRYRSYSMNFKDISGLTRKSDVKIAGVKVGWVEELELFKANGSQAQVKVMVMKDYKLYEDSHAIVRQDGLLGPKYLEVIPGDPLLPRLAAGATLSQPSVEGVSIDDLLKKFQTIATNVEEATGSIRGAIGGPVGREQMKDIFDNLHNTTQKLSSFSDMLEHSFDRNQESIDNFLQIGSDIRSLSKKLEDSVFPAFQESIEKISSVFDRDFDRVANKLVSTAEVFEDASIQARDGFRNVSSVAQKIDEGQGLLGKLVNEDDTYRDLKVAIKGIRNYFAKTDSLHIVFDPHFESMHRPAENYEHNDSKGYFNIRIHPNEDHFYVIGLATSEKGLVYRSQMNKKYFRQKGIPFKPEVDCVIDTMRPDFGSDDPAKLDMTDAERLENTDIIEYEYYKRNTFAPVLQFGKIFNDVSLRIGLFEGFAGVGIDYDIPFGTDRFRWVTTFEAFDFNGFNRRNDRRPHVKWLNRIFFLRSVYFTFGADDFASKKNANAFFGAGFRWGDDDVKYLMSSIGGMGGMGGGGGAPSLAICQ